MFMKDKSKDMSHIVKTQKNVIGGENWYGENFKNKIDGLTEAQAFERPVARVHTVAELISHITVWKDSIIGKLKGQPTGLTMESPENWKDNELLKQEGWERLKREFYESAETLVGLLEKRDDAFLEETYNGNGHDWRGLLEGLIQHDIYHLGQIAITLKLME